MIAGSSDPLFDDWRTWLSDPASEWSSLAALVAARGKSLVDDSPECAAMVRAKLLRIHGPNGLKFRSLYQEDQEPETTSQEVEKRRSIERAIKRGSRFIDAGGVLSRAEFDWQMSWNACVLGDAFAVRVWQEVPGIPTATRWRIVHPARVVSPDGKENDPRFCQGIELDANGRPAALWVDMARLSPSGLWTPQKPERFPWYAPDGTRNVVHKVGLRTPGSLRGLSEFAPIMLPARMLQGVTTAYVAMKRVQASHPMLLHVSDVRKAREAYRGTRIENLLIAADHKVEFPSWKFEGADYREFIDTTIRSLCAAWQIPWELVMGDHSGKSGTASRSLWQAHYQMAEREQADYVDPVARPIDESLVREADARDGLGLGDDWCDNMAGVYQGPPRIMPDPQKEVQWAEGMRALGMSRSTIMARMGEDFRDEVMQDRQDEELAKAQAPEPDPDAEMDDPQDTAETEADPANDAPEDAAEGDADDALEPGDPVAARNTLRKSASAIGDEMTRADFLAVIGALTAASKQQNQSQVVLQSRYEVKSEDVAELGAAIAAHMPQTIVNVPQQAAPTINVAQPPAAVNVHPAAASVVVQAADPAPVQVNVAPTPVTIENTVNVPQRTIKVTPQRDGTTIMEPQG